jgi:hypothetical protein
MLRGDASSVDHAMTLVVRIVDVHLSSLSLFCRYY